jgi:beta-N-acetylhexosaminidase
MRRILILLTSLVFAWSCHRHEKGFERIYAPFLLSDAAWADSMLLELTLEEKIGQLLVLQSDQEIAKDTLVSWVWKNNIGGWMPSGISLESFIDYTDTLQQLSRIPLFLGTKESVALNNQFTDTYPYPLPVTISAIPSRAKKDALLLQYAKQCATLNIHFSMNPVFRKADITARSYDVRAMENDPEEHLFMAYKTMSMLQDQKIIAVAGPFKELYFASENDQLALSKRDSLLNPYFNLSQNGLSGLMVDNSIFQADSNRFYPYGFLTKYLHDHSAFDGLIFGQPDLKATALDLLHGGVDVLLIKQAPWKVQASILQFVRDGFLSEDQLNDKVRKVLLAKTWQGLNQRQQCISKETVDTVFEKDNHVYPVYELYESALTLVTNRDSLVPFRNLQSQSFTLIHLGDASMRVFERAFEKYAAYSVYCDLEKDQAGGWKALQGNAFAKQTLVITLAEALLDPVKDAAFIQSVNQWSEKTTVVLANFGSPFNLRYFSSGVTMVQAYENNGITQNQSIQLLFGGMQARGQLPLALSKQLPYRQGFSTKITRLKFGALAQEVGIAPHKLVDIDAIIGEAIRAKAMPGCQILIAKGGKVIYNKSFGHFTYEKTRAVQNSDLYDIASVTKATATTIAVMKAHDLGLLKLNQSLTNVLDLKKNQLRGISIKDCLIHRTGLQSYIPITTYQNTRNIVRDGCNEYFCSSRQGEYNIRIAESLYLNVNELGHIWEDIYNVRQSKRKRYLYSDLNFVLLQKAVEKSSGLGLDKFVDQHFYEPLHLTRTTFNPSSRFSKEEIVPTAMDDRWRKELIHGYVHDESATIFQGVAGHAGLFSNAENMAVLGQLLLNKGSYGGTRFLKPSTVDLFVKKTSGNRGLGFEVKAKSDSPTYSPYASDNTFGHKGFTGTCIWIDPDNDLIFVFLTNRIHPNYKNDKLMRLKVRQRVHSVVYRALHSYHGKMQWGAGPLTHDPPITANWPLEEDCEESEG